MANTKRDALKNTTTTTNNISNKNYFQKNYEHNLETGTRLCGSIHLPGKYMPIAGGRMHHAVNREAEWTDAALLH
jgi:hypothetical protein